VLRRSRARGHESQRGLTRLSPRRRGCAHLLYHSNVTSKSAFELLRGPRG
jgi:hypothetical protein